MIPQNPGPINSKGKLWNIRSERDSHSFTLFSGKSVCYEREEPNFR